MLLDENIGVVRALVGVQLSAADVHARWFVYNKSHQLRRISLIENCSIQHSYKRICRRKIKIKMDVIFWCNLKSILHFSVKNIFTSTDGNQKKNPSISVYGAKVFELLWFYHGPSNFFLAVIDFHFFLILSSDPFLVVYFNSDANRN